MKPLKYTFIASLIFFFIAMLYLNRNQPQSNKKKITSSQSLYPLTPVSSVKKDNSLKTLKKKQTEPTLASVLLNRANADSKTKSDSELDYITAYRDWEYFANCYTDVNDFNNDKDPLDTLAERFDSNPRESQIEPTPQQKMYYQHHVDMCKTLINEISVNEQKEDEYYQIMQLLKIRYQSIVPKTKEQKQLAHALEMIQQLDEFNYEYANAQINRTTLSANEVDTIDIQIQRLTTEMMQIYTSNNPLNEEHIQQIKDYTDTIDALSKRISKNQEIDTELVTQMEATIDGHLNSIDDYLHRVQSADAFLLLSSKLYQSEYFKKESSVIKTLKESTQIYETYYINILNTIVMPLVACSMNYPCDADSDLILSYCLGLKDSMFNQACGKSLEDFYFNFYIGGNQLNDVNNYFSYLVSRYAN